MIRHLNRGVQLTDITNPFQNHHVPLPLRQQERVKKTSLFHVIVNTNQQFAPNSKELQMEAAQLEELANFVIDESNIANFVVFTKYAPVGSAWNSDWIDKIETEGAIERGEKYNQLHLHMLIFIDHYTHLTLDRDLIEKFFSEMLHLDRVYVKIQAHKSKESAKATLRGYIKKNQPTIVPDQEEEE